jgi:hypothetical protein
MSVLMGEVTSSTDSFTGVTTKNTEMMRIAAIHERGRDSIVEYSLNLEISAPTVSYSAVGAFVLFEDGSIWKRESEELTVTYRNGYKYSCYISLSPEEVKLFSEKKIDKIKLYVFENSMSEVHAVQFQREVGELL